MKNAEKIEQPPKTLEIKRHLANAWHSVVRFMDDVSYSKHCYNVEYGSAEYKNFTGSIRVRRIQT